MQRHIKRTAEFSANSNFQLTNSTVLVISVVTVGEYRIFSNLIRTLFIVSEG